MLQGYSENIKKRYAKMLYIKSVLEINRKMLGAIIQIQTKKLDRIYKSLCDKIR